MQDKPNAPHLPAIDAGQANDESVLRVHAQIRRARISGSPVAFFTAIALCIVFTFAWFYLRRYSAEFNSNSYLADREQIAALNAWMSREPEDTGPIVVDGAKAYAQNCAACHQPTGQGMAGIFPPLAGSEWVTGDPELPIKVVLSGLGGPVTVKGVSYNGAMPGLGGSLDDATIAAIVTYIRSSWDNGSGEVTAEQVAP